MLRRVMLSGVYAPPSVSTVRPMAARTALSYPLVQTLRGGSKGTKKTHDEWGSLAGRWGM